jgi:hypothetical protein
MTEVPTKEQFEGGTVTNVCGISAEVSHEMAADISELSTLDMSDLLQRAGAIGACYAGVQYDLNSTWRRLRSGEFVGAHLCDHNCTLQVDGVATGGNYLCPASLSLNHGVSKKRLASADVIRTSIKNIEDGAREACTDFLRNELEAYCTRFRIPPVAAAAIRHVFSQPELEINLFGGNPEMHPEIAAIIRDLRAAGHRVCFTTTGRRLMRDAKFVEDLLKAPPAMIALSADDFDGADDIHRLSALPRDELLSDWKKVPWQRGQRQKAHEAIYVARLADEHREFPTLLFNVVLHPGNLAHADSIVAALREHFPGVLVNPFPLQSAFLHEEPTLQAEHAHALREFIDRMLREQVAAAHDPKLKMPWVARVHYWLMLQAVFDWAGNDLDAAMRMIAGYGIWRCYQDSAAGRYLQVGMGRPHQKRASEDQYPGGHLGCFWNNETVTNDADQAWDMDASSITRYMKAGKRALGAQAARSCPGCAFPRLNFDMISTETGMSPELLPFYFKRRKHALHF